MQDLQIMQFEGIIKQPDQFLLELNGTYNGFGGQSAQNPIEPFTESRKSNNTGVFDKIKIGFGGFMKTLSKELALSEYANAMVALFQSTYFIGAKLAFLLTEKETKGLNKDQEIEIKSIKQVC